MNKKILLSILMLSAVLLATPYISMVHATKPTSVLFGVALPTVQVLYNEFRQDGPNWVEHDGLQAQLIGDIVGTMTSDARWVIQHWVGPVQDPYMLQVVHSTGHIVITVDPATIDGKTGTLTILFNQDVPTALAGTWVIIGGTGDLKSLHGQGTWTIPGFVNGVPCQVFEGQVHFDP
jgi:hypothetical protein